MIQLLQGHILPATSHSYLKSELFPLPNVRLKDRFSVTLIQPQTKSLSITGTCTVISITQVGQLTSRKIYHNPKQTQYRNSAKEEPTLTLRSNSLQRPV